MLGLFSATFSQGDSKTIDAGTASLLATRYSAAASARLPPAESPYTLTLLAPWAAISDSMRPAISGTTTPAVPPCCSSG